MVEYGRENLNLNIIKEDLETFTTEGQFDLVSLIQVIGHLHDSDKSLKLGGDF